MGRSWPSDSRSTCEIRWEGRDRGLAAGVGEGCGGSHCRRRWRSPAWAIRGSGPRLAKPKTLEGRGNEGELPWTLRAAGEGLSRRTPWPAAMGLAEARGQIERKVDGEEEREMASLEAQRVGAEATHFAGLKCGGIGDPGDGSPNATSKSGREGGDEMRAGGMARARPKRARRGENVVGEEWERLRH